MPEFVSEKINNEKMEQHTIGTSIELDVQGMPGFVSDKINGEKTKEHTPDILMEVDMVEKNPRLARSIARYRKQTGWES